MNMNDNILSFSKKLLYDSFQGYYHQELPTDDRGMFCFLCALIITRDTIDEATSVFNNFEYLSCACEENCIISLRVLKKIRNSITMAKRYICEIKSYANEEQLENWFQKSHKRFMNEKFWEEEVKKESRYLIEVLSEMH